SGCSFLAGAEAEMEAARNEKRADGKPRLPPGQYLLKALKPMGGDPGDPSPSAFRLRVYGQVKKELELSFSDLLALPQVQQRCDVHCVTKWTVLDSEWTGVRLQELADLAGVRSTARHVIFEAAHGYTANVPLAEALLPNVLIAHQHRGDPLAPDNGPPARSLVPDLYFWKSAKWITGVRFQAEDEPGYWETRGYHNHADPWKEERHSDV
ncbi:MAG: molybdopterin-binding oxidoreductase, partial [Armatimonadetes bacterium]|nr:molybdopterin-binding oxidoreductase [Armatimonadota bacterium]